MRTVSRPAAAGARGPARGGKGGKIVGVVREDFLEGKKRPVIKP